MKKLFHFRIFYLPILIVLTISSCSKDDPKISPELIVSTESLNFSNTTSIHSFHVKSNVDWAVTASEDWITTTPSSGSSGTTKIDVSVSENTTFDPRSAELTVTADNISNKVDITQAAGVRLTVEQNEFELSADGEELVISLNASAEYQISIDKDWLTNTDQTNQSATFLIPANAGIMTREATILFSLNGLTQEVIVKQPGQNLNIPSNMTGMLSNAMTLSDKMLIGWNLGNSLEATNEDGTMASETYWGNPKTNKAMIDAVKAAGFNAVRIPCAWSGYIEDETNYKIKDSWLARVKEVVDFVVDNDMYAIINIHWDGGWLENNPFYEKQEEINIKQKALWEQIAVYFRNYDERLLFAGTNEVHADYNDPTTEHLTVQMSFNQTFVDAVRSTGGRNAYRNLIVQAYNTNITHADNHLVLPNDPTPDRMFMEVHYYDPYDFALQENGNFKTQWGQSFEGGDVSNWGQEAWVDEAFGKMKTKFYDNGIPIILGEYGALLRTSLPTGLEAHKQARNYYLEYITKKAIENGMTPFYWDNGGTGNNGFGLFNRNTYEVIHQDALDAIMAGATRE